MKLCASLALPLTTTVLCAAAFLTSVPAAQAAETAAVAAPVEPVLAPVAASGCPTSATPGQVTCLAESRPATGVAAPAPDGPP